MCSITSLVNTVQFVHSSDREEAVASLGSHRQRPTVTSWTRSLRSQTQILPAMPICNGFLLSVQEIGGLGAESWFDQSLATVKAPLIQRYPVSKVKEPFKTNNTCVTEEPFYMIKINSLLLETVGWLRHTWHVNKWIVVDVLSPPLWPWFHEGISVCLLRLCIDNVILLYVHMWLEVVPTSPAFFNICPPNPHEYRLVFHHRNWKEQWWVAVKKPWLTVWPPASFTITKKCLSKVTHL